MQSRLITPNRKCYFSLVEKGTYPAFNKNFIFIDNDDKQKYVKHNSIYRKQVSSLLPFLLYLAFYLQQERGMVFKTYFLFSKQSSNVSYLVVQLLEELSADKSRFLLLLIRENFLMHQFKRSFNSLLFEKFISISKSVTTIFQ